MAQKGRTDLLFNVLFDAQLLLRLTPCLEVGTQTAPIFNTFPKLLRLTQSRKPVFFIINGHCYVGKQFTDKRTLLRRENREEFH